MYLRHILPPLISLRSCNLIYRKYRKFSFTFASWFLVAFISCDKKNSVLGVSAGGPWERNMVGGMNGDWGNVEFVPSVGI